MLVAGRGITRAENGKGARNLTNTSPQQNNASMAVAVRAVFIQRTEGRGSWGFPAMSG